MARSRERNWFMLGRNGQRKNATRKSPHRCRLGIEPLEERRMLSLTVPAFHSHPSATAKLYLDFDGSPAFDWGGTRAHGAGSNDAPIPAFTMDGDANNFSPAEITTITNIFNIVSEKFSPFNLDVTTVDPGNRTHGVTLTDIIGGSNSDWYGPGGGVSQVGSFTNTGLVNTVFAWTGDGSGWSTPEQITFLTDFTGGNTIPHEAGHAFGLGHQRTGGPFPLPINEYYDGDATRSPIMGSSANGDNVDKRGIWWLTNMEGGQQSPDPIQDELAIISGANNGFGYRADDFGYGSYVTLNTASDGSIGPYNGVIENTGDVDPFKFTAIGTTGTFKITSVLSATGGGMLQPSGRLIDQQTLQPIPYGIVVNGTTATLSSSSLVPGHNYFIEARSFGNYGDIGEYFVSGNLAGFASYDAASRTVTVRGLAGNNNVTMFTSGNTLTVQDSLNGGSTGTQNFTLSAVDSVSISLGGGDDKLNCIGLTKANNSALPVYIAMGNGFDTLNLGGGGTFLTFTVNSLAIDVSYANGARFAQFFNFDAERVEIHGTTSDSDLFNINGLNNYSTVYAYGDSGADKMVVSPAVMGAYTSAVIFYGEGGTDTLELDGSTLGFDQSFTMLGNAIQRFVPGYPFASEVQFDSTVEIFNIKGGLGNDTFDLLGVASGKTVNPTGNGGNDTYRVGNNGPAPVFQHPFTVYILGTINVVAGTGNDRLYIDDVAASGFFNGVTITSTSFLNTSTTGRITFDSTLESLEFHPSNGGSQFVTVKGLPASTALNLFGGTGIGDTLILDNSASFSPPFRTDFMPDSVVEYYGLVNDPTTRTLRLNSGWENFRYTGGFNTTTYNVYGTGTSPAGQSLQINGSNNGDTITVHPHDANGNLTINGSLSLNGSGGSDTLIVDDTGQANPIDYVFTNTFGGLIDGIGGLGTGTLSPFSIENVTLKAGAGDDTFDFNSFKNSNSIAIYGGDGNDVLNFGGDNIAANIANINSFLFDGQGGYNTENFRNANHTDSWVYGMSAASETISQSSLSANYTISLNDANVQQKTIFAGPNGDTMQASGLDAGQSLDFHGAAGDDALSLVSNPKFTAGRINFYGEGGTNNRILQISNSDTVGAILHINANTIGALPGDTFFAPGGSMYFDSLAAITLRMGSGADTAYVAPNAIATINISGGNPTAAPGDTLNLALAGAQNYVLNGTPSSGNVTSDNLKTLTYSGFETGPNIDDAAPYIVTQSYAAAAPPTILVQFSEDVSNALSVNYLELINTTTTEQVPFAYLNLAYDAGTNTASFTFPGYAGGILPPGDYTAKIYGSLPDQSGNVMGVETPFSFTVDVPPPALPGDYNLNGEVEAGDYILWRKTLGDTVAKYSGADGSGNSNIGPEDHDVWTANFGNALPAPASGNEAIFAEAHAGTESMRASATFMEATTIATLEVPAVQSVSIGSELPTVFGSDAESLNIATAFASAYGGIGKSSAFQAGGSIHARVTADHFPPPLTQRPTTVAGNRVVFDGYGRHFENFEADNAAAGLMCEAVDQVFDTDWANVSAVAI